MKARTDFSQKVLDEDTCLFFVLGKSFRRDYVVILVTYNLHVSVEMYV